MKPFIFCLRWLMFQILCCFVEVSAISQNFDRDVWSRQGRIQQDDHQFSLKYMFYHDLRNVTEPAKYHDVSSSQVFRANSQGQPHPYGATKIQSRPIKISKPHPPKSSLHHRKTTWITEEVPGPDVTDRDTVINLAKMTSDAYILDPHQPDWLNTSMGFNHSDSFGWVGDGLRGHVFTSVQNDTVIVAFKGTSVDPRDKWRFNDRVNDNILFSCCCADQRQDPYPYAPVCGCRTELFQCNATCVKEEMLVGERYYPTALAVMRNISLLYPYANVWATGHSMGGAMASLMGLTLHIPAVTYQGVPEKLPAIRLGLEIPEHSGAKHIGNNADPIFQGACNGITSSCSIGGYAFESQCYTGERCVYDTIGDKGWSLNIANHRINKVIKDVLEVYETVPSCEPDDECIDCFNWNYTEYKPGERLFQQ